MFKKGDIIKHNSIKEYLLILNVYRQGYEIMILDGDGYTRELHKSWIEDTYKKVA